MRLHDPQAGEAFACRGAAEVEAESVACLVSAHAGLDTSEYSIAYVATWAASASDDVLVATATRVRNAADRIIEQLPELSDAAPGPLTLA